MHTFTKIALAVSTVTVLGAGGLAAGRAFADTTTTGQNPESKLVQEIAQKFNLNQSDVQAVFDQNKQEQAAQRETDYENRLTQLVTDGKITDAQKQLIIAKNQELEANRQSEMAQFKSETAAQRKTAMEADRTALQTWATQNGIDIKYLMFGGFGGRRGPRPGMAHNGTQPTPTPTASPTTQQ